MDRLTVLDVVPFVRALYREEDLCTRDAGCVGGHLHIVLDDYNVEDEHVEFCRLEACKDKCTTCERLAILLLRMTKTQRLKVARMK